MRQYKSEYARRGEIERRRARWRNGIIAVLACGVGVVAFEGHRPSEARAEATPLLVVGPSDLRNQLDETRGKLDLATAQLRDCISYYNGEGNAAPGSLAYYGGGKWHKHRIPAQSTLEPYLFEDPDSTLSE